MLFCLVMLLALFVLDARDAFEGFWLADIVGIGDTLGTQGAVTVAGLLLASELRRNPGARGFAIALMLACIVAAWFVGQIYGYNKNASTPGYALMASAVTTGLWLLVDLCNEHQVTNKLISIAAMAGTNVLLAYLLSEALPFVLQLSHLTDSYHELSQTNLAAAMLRSLLCAVTLLAISIRLNRFGFVLRL